MKKALSSFEEAAKLVKDGDVMTTGGATFHRAPMAFLNEIVRQGKKDLVLVDREPAIDFDLLIGAGCVAKVRAGLLAFELLGFAPNFRKKSESGEIITKEGACQPIIAGFRAAAMGIPSLPIRGMLGSDLLDISEILGSQQEFEDPFTGEKLIAVRAIEPDVAVLHAQQADEFGNTRIEGPKYEDVIKAKAAKTVIVTAEEIISSDEIRKTPEATSIPHFLVDAVVHAPNGAYPCSCFNRYDTDYEHIQEYVAAVNSDQFETYLEQYVHGGGAA
ncbi:MAG: CoA transferase subunit A [Rhodospirillales bacterium]|jgi:glutaconate CoA-transferase, subunit A|nr:CoA transferase subunit A [Rhodospirillales bacterium]MBT7942642.1 CoA transferase subunit A [Alphaproteobacteria bacterium]